jgi:hypothetical protein
MRNLLHATDRDRLVAHLRGHLLREVAVDGRRLTALAEAEGPLGGSFCAAPANARAAELLVQPAIRDADPAFADAVLDFVMAMADAPLPCRRAAVGGIELVRADPRDFEILTPFHRFTGDLGAGILRQQLRGAAEALPPVLHTGNLVHFRIGRHRLSVDAEDSIRHVELRRAGDDLVLAHESRITGRAGLLRARPAEAGTLRYEYRIAAGSPLLRLTVSFAAAEERVASLRLTSAVDAMDATGLELAEAALAEGAGWRRFGPPGEAGLGTWTEGEQADHLAIGQTGWPAGGPTLHIRPAGPAALSSVKATASRPGALRWLVLRHGPADLPPGGSLVAREERLLAAGTPAEAAARAMTAPAVAGLDLDPLPPDGAALNAVATLLLFDACGAGRTHLAPSRRAALQGWLARQGAALLAGQPGLTDLGYAALAAEAELRAGGDDTARRRLEDLAGRLLAAQLPGGAFAEPGGGTAGLAAHAVAVLALARAATQLDPVPLGAAIGRALAVVTRGAVEATAIGRRATRIDGMAVAGGPPVLLHGHAEAIGLVARAAGAVVLAAEATGGEPSPEVVARARELHRQAIDLLRPLVRVRGATLEVTPSPLGGTASPAGQAAVALGLLAPEALLLRLGEARARVAA